MNLLVPKVIVIDDDISLYPTYENYFDTYLDYDLKGIYHSVKEALSNLSKVQPHIILLDVSQHNNTGIKSITHFKKQDAEVKIIMLSTPQNFEVVKKAFKNGANGFLTKPMSQRTLYNALYSIECQGAFISNDIAKKVIAMFQRKSYRLFSERENQVIDLLRQGATYKTIADKLFVTASAINFHIQNIYLKLDVNSKSQALSKLQELEKSLDFSQ